MDQAPNCRKCSHCYWDGLWKEWICDKHRHAIYSLNEWSTCKSYQERSEENGTCEKM